MSKRKLSLKLFGSLSNLSFRRSTEKTGTKAPLEHDGSVCDAKSAATGSQSVDDMSCLHSPGYARSCEMYTHVGTVPRNEKQKKSFKALKEKKTKTEEKEEGEEGMSEGQDKWKAGEHVRDSPLLSALTSLSLNNMEKPQPASASAQPLPASLTPSRTSPLTSASDSCISDDAVEPLASSEVLKSKNDLETARKPSINSLKATSNQDLYVPMDPIAETGHMDPQTERLQDLTRTQETNRFVKNSQEVEGRDK